MSNPTQTISVSLQDLQNLFNLRSNILAAAPAPALSIMQQSAPVCYVLFILLSIYFLFHAVGNKIQDTSHLFVKFRW
jgi:hypothetical protein